jgi:hypothetical protein
LDKKYNNEIESINTFNDTRMFQDLFEQSLDGIVLTSTGFKKFLIMKFYGKLYRKKLLNLSILPLNGNNFVLKATPLASFSA